ncbi:TPA: hypothetical protein ACPJ0D_000317 [Vibrio diabolicus]
MESVFNFFNQGWVGSLIGVIGVIFGVVGMFSYKFSKSSAKPSYQAASLRLIGRDEDNLPEDVTVLYKGTEVERLAKTKLVIWNNGTEVLNGEDIVESDPLRVSFPVGSNILSYQVIKTTRDTNQFSLYKDESVENELYIQFSYLDPKDGATIEILHDSEERHPSILGTIKGLPKGLEYLGRFYTNKTTNAKFPINFLLSSRKLVLWVTIFMGILFFFGSLLPAEITKIVIEKDPTNDTALRVILGVTGFVYTVMPATLLWSRREKYPKVLSTNELES